jgi:hypothetical protein
MVTGGTPKTTGVFYDDSYSHALWAPGNACSGAPGTETQYAENLDKLVNGGTPLFTTIDPANLPMGMLTGNCVPIFPHSFLKTNTIFEVAHNAGLRTAWADKHPAYELVNGPSGSGVDDLFTPEINNDSNPTGTSVAATAANDQLKVNAVLHEIDGLTSDGQHSAPVPAIFGMNFQAVSVGQKLVDPVKSCQRNPTATCDPTYFPGGYQPGTLHFTPQLASGLAYVDGALGTMVAELRKQDLLDSTTIVISAKHGQSPIDPASLFKIGDQITPILTAAGITAAQTTEDDIALVWLQDQTQTAVAVKALRTNQAGPNKARIQSVLSGDALADHFGDPLRNDRTPDLIVQPIPGTIYTGSKAKVAEHGGFAEDDTHVALLVVNGAANDDRDARTHTEPVHTTQIAPTILRILGLRPEALKAVQLEHTAPLPR